MKYSTSDIKNGLKVLIDGEPCIIIDNEFEKLAKRRSHPCQVRATAYRKSPGQNL